MSKFSLGPPALNFDFTHLHFSDLFFSGEGTSRKGLRGSLLDPLKSLDTFLGWLRRGSSTTRRSVLHIQVSDSVSSSSWLTKKGRLDRAFREVLVSILQYGGQIFLPLYTRLQNTGQLGGKNAPRTSHEKVLSITLSVLLT